MINKPTTIKSAALALIWTTASCLLVLAADNIASNSGCNPEQAVIKLEENYRRCGPITFTFEQQTISAVFGDETRRDGQVWFDSSGRFRMETAQETFLKNGDTLWHWVPAYDQVTVQSVDSASSVGGPADFLWTLRRDFLPMDCRMDTTGGRTHYIIRMTAKTATAAIQQLTMWINPATYFVDHAEYTDYNDDQVKLQFSAVGEDTLAASVRYRPQFPDSVEVVIIPQKKHQQNANTPR